MTRAVFLDTVGILGVWDRGDQWHEPVSRVMSELLQTGGRIGQALTLLG